MRKALVLLLICLTPIVARADFQLGGVALYNGDITTFGTRPVSTGDFSFGLESRFGFLSVLQLGLTGLYYLPSTSGGSSYIQALTDVGLSVNVFFLRFGAGVGPVFFIPMSGPPVSATSVMNLKFMADIEMGPVSIGAVAFYPVQTLDELLNFNRHQPWVGIMALVKLF